MASPTETEVDTQLTNAIAMLDNLLTQHSVPADEDTYIQSLESDYSAAQAAGARLFRSRLAGAISSGSSVLNPLLTAYSHHVVGTPERSPQPALDRIYQYFEDNNKSVLSRGVTYGSIPSFGTNKGVVVRLTVDENSYNLENEFAEAKVIKCIRDENTGAERFREVFEIRGPNAGIDSLSATGSGQVRRDLRAKDSSDSLLQNPSFSRYTIAGSFTAGRYALQSGDTVAGWTMSLDTGFELDQNTSLVARDIVGDATPTSIVATTGATRTLTQAFSVNRLQLSADVPYLPEIWIRPDAALTAGTAQIDWGSQSVSVDLSTITAGAWYSLKGAMDNKLWPATFNEADATFVITISSHDSEVLIDEVFFAPMEPFDGTWWHVSATSASKFLLDDKITVTDSISSDSKVQKWLWRTYGRYLPHYANATQVPAAGGRTLTFADADPDTITASSGSFVTDGYVAGQQLTVAGTASNDGTYTLATVTATVLTLIAADTLAAEGPLSSGETLDAGPSIADPA